MDRFSPNSLFEFLECVDRHLDGGQNVIIIGGAAASLAYGATRSTTDIDVITPISSGLQVAIELAIKESGLDVPVSHVGVYEAPYEFEDRLHPVRGIEFQRLKIYVPERHDLALMKITRGYENDIQVIREMHEHSPLDQHVLIDRFMNEMTHILGNHGVIRLSFIAMFEILFGSDIAAEIEQQTLEWSPLQMQN